jgi:hypothetical protein
MPRYITDARSYHCPPDIVRFIRVLSGRPKVRIRYNPRPNYAEHPVDMQITSNFIKHYTAGGTYESLYLYSDLPFDGIVEQEPIALDKDCFLLVSYNQKLKPTIGLGRTGV